MCWHRGFPHFSLLYRKRVAIWFDVCPRDIVNEFAPWAIPFITEWAAVEPISCKGEDGRLFLHGDNLHTINHWVAGVTEDGLSLIHI